MLPMDFDYDALAALAAVVREGRFDAAAKSLIGKWDHLNS